MRHIEFLALLCTFGTVLLLGNADLADEQPSQLEVWACIQEEAAAADLDPEFVYAIAMAESSLKADADSGSARGIMQLTESAWETVTSLPYRFAWDWRLNIQMGVLYLGVCKRFLIENDAYSMSTLAASYRYGMYRVKANDFNVLFLPVPTNTIYHKLLYQEEIPVEPPVSPVNEDGTHALYRDSEEGSDVLRIL
jgi:hypothetical protein